MSSSSEEDTALDSASGVLKILPKLSKETYRRAYDDFMTWRSKKELDSFSEDVFVLYFEELSNKYKSTTIWSIYSMLVATMQIKHGVRIKDYLKITPLLKKLKGRFEKKRSKVFSLRDIETFLNKADDEECLALKVVLIFGIKGACQIGDFAKITVDSVQMYDKLLYVTLPHIRSKPERMFAIQDHYIDIVEKYRACRPKDVLTKRFFLTYKCGQCTDQYIGLHKFTIMPRQIAAYLNLPNPECYTGHCFRRTSLIHKLDTVTTLIHHCFNQKEKSPDVAEDVPNQRLQPSSEVLPCTSQGSAQNGVPKLLSEETASNGNSTITWEYDISMSPLSSKEEQTMGCAYAHPSSTETLKRMSIKREPRPSRHYRGRATLSGLQHTIINVPGKSVTVTIKNCSNFNVKLRQNE